MDTVSVNGCLNIGPGFTSPLGEIMMTNKRVEVLIESKSSSVINLSSFRISNTHTFCRWFWVSPRCRQPGSEWWECDAGRTLQSTGSAPRNECRSVTSFDPPNGRSPPWVVSHTALQKNNQGHLWNHAQNLKSVFLIFYFLNNLWSQLCILGPVPVSLCAFKWSRDERNHRYGFLYYLIYL